MKRFLALLLVLVLVVGLVACGNKDPKPTDPTTGKTDPTQGATQPTVNEKPFKGKTLQLYGFGTDTSYSAFGDEEGAMSGVGNYLWMQRAAILEWAADNEVTIEFKGSYNDNVLLAAMNSGEKPDLLTASNKFPANANIGLTAKLTDAEYNELSKYMINTNYLDLMKYNGQVNGVLLPYTGFFQLHVNIDLCERYGIKSPVDYFKEGNWNWDTMKTFFVDVTRDIDGDGDLESAAVRSDFFLQGLIPYYTLDEKGGLTDEIFDKSWAYDYAEFRYNYQHQKNCVISGAQSVAVMAGDPLIAMQLTDCEIYNPLSIFKYLSNGDAVQACPVPEYKGKDALKLAKPTQSCMFMSAACDEREATLSLMCYILACGEKWISEMSHGAVTSRYEGVKGSTELSKKYLDAFNAGLAARVEQLKDYDHYDKDYATKLYNYVIKDTNWEAGGTYTGVTQFVKVCTFSDPPATAMAAGREKYKTQIATYNSLYVHY